MNLAELLPVVLSVIYAVGLLGGLRRVRRTSVDKVPSQPVTVIVPVRNEASKVAACLEGLAAQRLPLDQVQVIVVDDRSEDGTPEIVRSWQRVLPSLELIELQGPPRLDLAPKKEALLAGLKRARHPVIALLDGDSVPANTWLRSTVAALTERVVACVGPVLFLGSGFWTRVAELEFLGLQAAGWIALAYGQALNASAANMTFRLRGSPNFSSLRNDVASGDDVFLVQHLVAHGEARALVEKRALVWTRPPSSVREFVLQRVRWASKLLNYSTSGIAQLVLVYLYHVFLVLLALGVWLGHPPVWTFVSALGLKLGTDLVVAIWATEQLGVGRRVVFFPLAELLLNTEVILAPLALLLPFKWKGRRYGPGGKMATRR